MRASAIVIAGWVGLAGAGEPVDYVRQVKPLLAGRCFACHGALKQEANLRLDTAAFLRHGGDSGPAIQPGQGDESLLIQRVRDPDESGRMPPHDVGTRLAEAEVSILARWIDEGAVAPADESPESDPKDHWAFRGIIRPGPPHTDEPASEGPVDAFLADKRVKAGIELQPKSPPSLLLRRVSLDLVGLPPTLDDLRDFESDERPDAFEKVVDRLLASPAHGERWGRHWMDVWRYSDWWGLGDDLRNSQKHIWHWRDWIIESLNANVGYDEMVRQMLAADELYPTDPDRLRATGYLARQYFKFNRTTWLDETIEHTAKAFLGLTLNCAKCHDHKYDPIAQEDYYRFRAFFEPYQVRLDQVPGELDFEKDGIPRAFDCNLDAPTYLFVRGDEKTPRSDKPMPPALPAILTSVTGEPAIESLELPLEACRPGLRPFVLEDHLRLVRSRLAALEQDLESARRVLAALEQSLRDLPPFARTDFQFDPLGHWNFRPGKWRHPPTVWQASKAAVELADRKLAVAMAEPDLLRARASADRAKATSSSNAADLARTASKLERQQTLRTADADLAAAVLERLTIDDKKKDEADKRIASAREAVAKARLAVDADDETYTPLAGARKSPESNIEEEASRSRPFPTISTGRRRALAMWLTRPDHPLTARVAVNHVWTRHFGRPIVETLFDFGRKGSPPTHPELLDDLASEFIERGWEMKHLHRRLVTSRAYQTTSSEVGASQDTLRLDPENKLYWRGNPLRMESQVVRDVALALADELNLQMAGPSVPLSEQETSRRRSLYFVHSHNDQHRFLLVFDDANVLQCYRRSESIVPQQALALFNSRLALESSARIAARLERAASDEEFIREAFITVLATVPTPEEEFACLDALEQLRAADRASSDADVARRARVGVIHALLNHNDFVTIR